LEIVASGLRGVLERLDELNSDLVCPLPLSPPIFYISRKDNRDEKADKQNLDLRGKQGVGHGYYGMLVRRLKELCSALVGGQDQDIGDMDQD
jgi:hypothetical protein